VEEVTAGKVPPNVIIADYTNIGLERARMNLQLLLGIDRKQRNEIERRVASQVAQQIIERLPRDPRQRDDLIHIGYELASQMSWDVIVRRFVIPALEKACHNGRASTAA